jgi:hypothetical protein
MKKEKWEIGENCSQRIGNINGAARGLDSRQSNHFLSIEGSYSYVKTYRIINQKEYA